MRSWSRNIKKLLPKKKIKKNEKPFCGKCLGLASEQSMKTLHSNDVNVQDILMQVSFFLPSPPMILFICTFDRILYTDADWLQDNTASIVVHTWHGTLGGKAWIVTYLSGLWFVEANVCCHRACQSCFCSVLLTLP